MSSRAEETTIAVSRMRTAQFSTAIDCPTSCTQYTVLLTGTVQAFGGRAGVAELLSDSQHSSSTNRKESLSKHVVLWPRRHWMRPHGLPVISAQVCSSARTVSRVA